MAEQQKTPITPITPIGLMSNPLEPIQSFTVARKQGGGYAMTDKTKTGLMKHLEPDSKMMPIMVARLMRRLKIRKQVMAHLIGINSLLINDYLMGKREWSTPKKRILWTLYCQAFHPEILRDIMGWITWGRATISIRPGYEISYQRFIKMQRPSRDKLARRQPRVPLFAPHSIYMTLDWNLSNAVLANDVRVDIEKVRKLRALFQRWSKERLSKHVLDCGKPLENFACFLVK